MTIVQSSVSAIEAATHEGRVNFLDVVGQRFLWYRINEYVI